MYLFKLRSVLLSLIVLYSTCLISQNGFTENQGQLIDQYGHQNIHTNFLFHGNGAQIQLNKNGFSYEFFEMKKTEEEINRDKSIPSLQRQSGSIRTNRIDVELIGMNSDFRIEKFSPLKNMTHVYNDNGEFENIKTYERIVYRSIYPGVDLEFVMDSEGRPKYNFIVHEPSSLETIRLKYSGHEELTVTPRAINIKCPLASFSDEIPLSYFKDRSVETETVVEYKQLENNVVCFDLKAPLLKGDLIIDPFPDMEWSTYIGCWDAGYATGFTPDFDVLYSGTSWCGGLATVGAYDTVQSGREDAIVRKYDEDGALLWSTYYGNIVGEGAIDIRSDSDGNIYFTGWFGSGDYATTPGAHQESHGGGAYDAGLVKLAPDGTRLWGTFYGGEGYDEAYSLAIDASDKVYIMGYTATGSNSSAIASAGAHQTSRSGGADNFIAKFSPDGTRIWGTYFGGSGGEGGAVKCGIDTDEDNNILIAGHTSSTNGIATAGAHLTTKQGGNDGYIAKLDSLGSLIWGTYTGGTADDVVTGAVFDSSGDIFVSGYTDSNSGISTSGAYDEDYNGITSGFVQKFDGDGNLISGTYLGQSFLMDMENYCNEVVVFGQTKSLSYPTTPGVLKTDKTGLWDYTLSMLDESLEELVFSSYFGGDSNDSQDDAYIAGISCSSDFGGSEFAFAGTTLSDEGIIFGNGEDQDHSYFDGFLALFSVGDRPGLISADSDEICAGETFELTAPEGYESYVWGNGMGTNDTLTVMPTSNSFYSLEATAVGGCRFFDTFQLDVEPGSNISIDLSESEICLGQSFEINTAGSHPYTWNGGISDGDIITPASTGVFEYSLEGTNPSSNCTNTVVASVTVSQGPTVTASSNKTEICEGGSITLQGSGADSYSWNLGVTNNQSFNPVSTQTYTVTGTTSEGCFNTADIEVVVNQNPTVVASASDSEICLGESLTLSGGGALQYSWTNGITNGESFEPASAGVINYTVTGTNNITGCEKTADIEITVNSLPNIGASASNTEICVGESVVLTGSGADNYSWTGGVTDGGSFSPSSTGSVTYTVTGTETSSGCQNTSSIDVITNSLPVVTALASEVMVCEGDSVIFEGIGANTYVWNQGVTNQEAFYPIVGTETYQVTGTNSANGCMNVSSVDVTVNALPNVTASVTESEICVGDSVIFSGAGADTYNWSNDVINGIYFTPFSSGTTTYTVIGIDVLSRCENTTTVDLTVNSLPGISANSSHESICLGDSIILNGAGAETYEWNYGAENGQWFTPESSGEISFKVIGSSSGIGCSGLDSVLVSVNNLPEILATANSSSICLGESIIFTGDGGTNYQWSQGVINGMSFTPNSEGTQTFSLTGQESITGCSNSDDIEITVNPLPVISLSLGQASICLGESVELIASGVDAFSWNVTLEDDGSYMPSSAGLTSISVSGTDNSTGCQNSSNAEVFVQSLPIIEATVSSENVCQEEEIILNATGADSFIWEDGYFSQMPFSLSDIGDYTFTVFGTDEMTGCTGQNSVSLEVFSNPPNVQAVSTETDMCFGESTVFSASGALTYIWSDGIVEGEEFVPLEGEHTYMLIGQINAENCQDTAFVSIQVHALPEVNAGEDLTLCINSEFVLEAETEEEFESLTWSSGIENGESTIATLEGNQTFIVTVKDQNGCEKSDEVMVHVQNCDTLVFLPSGISPNGDGVNDFLEISGSAGEPIRINVFSEWGLEVYKSEDYKNDWNGFNQSSSAFEENKKLPTGTYYYTVQIGDVTHRNYLYISY